MADETRLKSSLELAMERLRQKDAESGVTVRRGQVAVAARGSFQVFDASMSGNLAIFRQRAARTALNRLRLLLLSES